MENHNPSSNATFPPSDSSLSELNRNLKKIRQLNRKINKLPDTTKIIESVVFRSPTRGGKKDISHQSDYSCLDHESGGN